jgi:hypothetical protein
MLKQILPVAACLALLAAARPSHACDPAPESTASSGGCGAGAVYAAAVVIGGVVGAVDLAFTIHAAAKAAQGERGSKGVAFAQVVIAAPQAYFFTRAAVEEPSTFTVGMAVWTAALTAHAVYTLAAPAEQEVPVPVLRVGEHAALVPAGAGVGLVGRF